MKKTYTISIQNTPFTIEEDAYTKLDTYLKALQEHFAANPERDEIIRDIESRIAEKLAEKNRVILTNADVGTIIADMGEVGQFEQDTTAPHTNTPKPQRHLYRDIDTAVVAGVAAGLGRYFAIDPWIIRLIFILIVVAGGSGILIYIILWIIIPAAETTAQKLEMNGEPVTVATMSASIREKIEGLDTEKVTKLPIRILRAIARGIQSIVFPVMRFLFGSIFVMSGFALSLGITIAIGVLCVTGAAAFADPSFYPLLTSAVFYGAILSVYFVILIPALFVFFVGIWAVTRTFHLSKLVGWTLFAVWALALALSGILASRIAVRGNEIMATHVSFKETTKTIETEPFSKISVEDTFRVRYVEGASYSVVLDGRAYDIDHATALVSNNTLSLQQTKPVRGCFIFCNQMPVGVTITAPSLTDVSTKDAARFDGTLTSTKPVSLTATDVSRIESETTAPQVTVHVRDAARIVLSGSADTTTVMTTDVARLNARDFIAQEATITALDASRANMSIVKKLTAIARDIASIEYTGTPAATTETHDAGSIKEIKE